MLSLNSCTNILKLKLLIILQGYYLTGVFTASEERYTMSWLTPQCVLVLRMIGELLVHIVHQFVLFLLDHSLCIKP